MSEHTQQEMARLRDHLAECNERQAEIVARMHRLRQHCKHERTEVFTGQYCHSVQCLDCGALIESRHD